MNDVYSIALVFSRSGYRYYNYACRQAAALLNLNKRVFIFSHDWVRINDYLHTHYAHKKNFFVCAGLSFTPNQNAVSKSVYNLWQLKQQLVQTEKKYQCRPDLVMFCPTDDWFLGNMPRWIIERMFNYKWTGIYLDLTSYYKKTLPLNVDPKRGEPDYYFLANNCIGVVLLDRFMGKEVQSRVYKKVVVFPDISLRPKSINQQTVNQIKSMAKNRMVVGTMILDNENIVNFLQTAMHADVDRYFFVCAGNLEQVVLNEKAKLLLNQLLAKGLQNNYFVVNDFDEDEEINALLQSFDVCYLNDGSYMEPHPLLTKAALMHKPVIASKYDVIGKLVETFKTGICVGNKTSQSLQALDLLRMQMPFESNFDMNKLNNYASLQNEYALVESLEELLLF